MTCTETVCYSCGHTREITSSSDANWHARVQRTWIGSHRPCFGCNSRDYKHRIERRDYFLAPLGELPELTGSPKQIEWAVEIREGALVEFEYWLPSQVKDLEIQSAVRSHLLARTYAGWWIERRELRPHHLIRQTIIAILASPPPRKRL